MANMLFLPTYSRSGTVFGQSVIALFDIGGLNDGATATGIAELWRDFVTASLDQEVQVDGNPRFIFPEVDPTGELIASTAPAAGSTTGDLAPLNTCYALRLSAGYGRRRRGRIFLPGVDEAKVNDGGVLVGTTASDILSNAVSFATDCATDLGFALGVFSRLDGVTRIAQTLSVPGVVSTQRRRLYAL